MLLELKDLGFSYNRHKIENRILNQVNATFEDGKLYAVLGRSGTGKTTLLSLLGALERPKRGEILYNGKSIAEIGEKNFRRQYVGIIFQEYNLLEYMTAVQNVVAAMKIAKPKDIKHYDKRAYELLEQVGLDHDKANSKVNDLSGGEQQRTAIARALAKNASLLLADEPTGNLDFQTGQEIIEIFRKIAHEDNKCVIVATHSVEFAKQADIVLNVESTNLAMVKSNAQAVSSCDC